MKNWDINVELHKRLIDHAEALYSSKRYKEVADLASNLANIEMRHYIGYLSSVRLEELLLKTGKALFPVFNFKKKSQTKRKVLHIGTEFYNVGGHTRVVLDWIENDKESYSEILLTNPQRTFDLPTSTKVSFLKKGDNIARAKELRAFLANNYFDIIISHQNMADVVPTLALWDLKTTNNSLVLFYNHSDFRFSLGNIIAHKRVNFTEGNKKISLTYRYPMQECVLPFVLGETLPEKKSSEFLLKKKKELGVENQTVFMSIGSAYKYRPFQAQNFLAEWNEFLSKEDNISLIMIGCTNKDFETYCPNIKKSPNLKLLGIVVDPTEYYQISDYILDIYPLPTGLGMIRGLFYGLAPILPYAENVLVMGEDAKTLYPKGIRDLLLYTDKQSYFNFIRTEIKNRSYQIRAKQIIEDYITNNLLAKAWRKQLEIIYNKETIVKENFDKQVDVLNVSRLSKKWYEFTKSPGRSFSLMMLLFTSNIPFTWTILVLYIKLIIRHGRISGTGLGIFSKYLLGRYK